MCSDSIIIGGTNRNLSKDTTSGAFFYDKDNANRRSNSNVQYTFMPNINALKSHYPQMNGQFTGATEQKSKFVCPGAGANPGLG